MSKFKFANPIGKMKNPLFRGSQAEVELYDPRKHGVRQSTLETWMSCREKARLSAIHGWRERGASVPLIYGSLSHGTIKGAYRDMRAGKISLEEVLGKSNQYLAESEKEWLDEVKTPTTEQKDIKENSIAILQRKMPLYFDYWYEHDTDVEWSMVEDKFMVKMIMDDGAEVPLTGTFDATFKKSDGGLWLFETKNKARWSDKISDYLPMDLQLGIYMTALQSLYGLIPAGVRYNLLRRPGERKKVTESQKEYAERIEFNIKKDQDHYFQRMDIPFTREEIDEHVNRTCFIVNAFYEWWKETMKHPDNRDLLWNGASCEGKYGTCRMLDACTKKDFTSYERRSPADAAGIEEME